MTNLATNDQRPSNHDHALNCPCPQCQPHKWYERATKAEALLREVYNHGENGELHSRIGAYFGVEPGECIPVEPSENHGG